MDDQHHLNDDGGERGEDGLEQRPLLAIESLDDYVNRFGLPHAPGGELIVDTVTSYHHVNFHVRVLSTHHLLPCPHLPSSLLPIWHGR